MNWNGTLRLGFRHNWVLAILAALFSMLLAESLYRSGSADRIEHLYSDTWHRLAGLRHTPAHAALVMIDDPSLNARPDEPLVFWTPHLARALATLRAAGVKTVAVDFIFSGSPERWIEKLGLVTGNASFARDYDRPFRSQINSGEVLLAGFKVGTGDTVDDFILPSPDYLLALPELDMVPGIGLANLRADTDSAVRSFVLAEATSAFARNEGMPLLAFGPLAAVRASGQNPRADLLRFGERDLSAAAATLHIAYAGPAGTFKPVSFGLLLQPDALTLPEVQALRGKVVVLGAGYAGMNDVHPTPYSTSLGGANSLMAGPEIQANIVETLLSGRFIEEVPAAARVATFLLVLSALAYAGMFLSHWWMVALVAATLLLTGRLAFALFEADILFPIAHLHIGMVAVLGCLALLRLTREERERARIGAMFGRYVSGQVMTALLNSPDLPELGGKATRITVLFSDIRNFTSLSEKLTATEVVEMLNTYFERACTVLLAEDATIDKFIGDAVMAEFGAPLPQADHADRAVRAAVALRRVAIEFRSWMQQRFPNRDLLDFDIGIGLHTGEAVVGNIGSSTRMEYTAIGDSVNIAARLESMTRSTGCTLLASRDTVESCTQPVRTGMLHSLHVKGRVQPVDAYEVLNDEN